MTFSDTKTVLITGANSGIGYETSVKLASQGWHVVMVARNRERGEQAKASILSRVQSGQVSLLLCDLAALASVRQLARDFVSTHSRLDVLINNAGSSKQKRELTAEGIEYTFAANYLGHFLLTNLLLDQLRASAPARIINVGSNAYRLATLDFGNLQFEKGGYAAFKAYNRSKLYVLLFTRELAHRLEGTSVTVNAIHPGLIDSGIWAKAGLPWYLMGPVEVGKKLLMQSPAQGADRIVYAATSDTLSGQSGGYYEKGRLSKPNRLAGDEENGRRLWNVSERLAGLAND